MTKESNSSSVAAKPELRVSCYNCSEDDGFMVGHECGDDSCCCLNPMPNVPCDICGGKGYWLVDDTPENYRFLADAGLEFMELEP